MKGTRFLRAFTVDGLSLVRSYRTSFNEEIANRGTDGLIGVLASKNRS